MLKNFPIVIQDNDYSCGLACTKAILQFYNIFYTDKHLYELLETNETFGTNSSKVVETLSKHFLINVFENSNIKQLKKIVKQGYPILTLIQAYKDDENVLYKNTFECGHYVVIIGFEKNHFILMDSATEDVYKKISTEELLNRWCDEDENDTVYRNCYFIQVKKEKTNLKTIKHIE